MDFTYQSPPFLLDGRTFIVRNILPEDSITELTGLLHRAYKRLADMNLRFVATYQPPETTIERITSGYCFVVVEHDRTVGTMTLYPPDTKSNCEFYSRQGVWCFGQFAVEPSLQSIGVGGIMLRAGEEFAAQTGATYLALDTAEPAEHLIRYYTKRGYCFEQFVQWDVTNYRSVVMSKKLR